MTACHARRVWTEQCKAAEAIRTRYGLRSAFDYLVTEKFLNFVDAAHDNPEFARELPSFIAAVRSIFALQELQESLAQVEREQKQDAADLAQTTDEEGNDFADPPALVAARRERFETMKEMLLEVHLGTS